jgi:hypothetical protein
VGHAPLFHASTRKPQYPQTTSGVKNRCRLAKTPQFCGLLQITLASVKESFTIDTSTTGEHCMKANQTQREELYQLITLARAQREKTARAEELVGNVLFSVLGACVLFTIVLWVIR